MSDTLTIADRVRKIVGEHLGQYERGRIVPRAFEWDDTLESMGADSLDLIELCMAIEEEFNVEISEEAVDGWRTAGDLLRSVEGQR